MRWILLLIPVFSWAQNSEFLRSDNLIEPELPFDSTETKISKYHYPRRDRRVRRHRYPYHCPNNVAVKVINDLQGKLESYLQTCRFELAANLASSNFIFSTIDLSCGEIKPCLLNGNLTEYVQRFYDIDSQKQKDNSFRYLRNGTILVDRISVDVNGTENSKINSHLYTFQWDALGHCEYQLSYIYGNNSRFPPFMDKLDPCPDCIDPFVQEVVAIQKLVGACNSTDPNLYFLSKTPFMQLEHCPAIPGACCISQDLEEASLFYSAVCGSDSHIFGEPTRVDPTHVVSELKTGPIGGPYVTLLIAYEFTENPPALTKIYLLPEDCFSQPLPGPCSGCPDPAIYQVDKLQKDIIAGNSNVRYSPIPIKRCGSCNLSPGTSCVINEDAITFYYDLVNNAKDPSFSALDFYLSLPGDDGVFIKTVLTIETDDIDVIFYLTKGVNGAYTIESIQVFDGCDVGLLQGCDLCPDPAVTALVKLQETLEKCDTTTLDPINNFSYRKTKLCTDGGDISCCTNFEGNKAELYDVFCPALAGELSFDGPWYATGTPGDDSFWMGTTLIYPGDVTEDWLVQMDRVDADNFKISELIRFSPNCPSSFGYGSCIFCGGTVSEDS